MKPEILRNDLPRMTIDIDLLRAQFPALAITDDGQPRIYLDNPAGTQVPQRVVDAVSDCLLHANANLGGGFASSDRADAVVAAARDKLAAFLNAASADEIAFGNNMTTLTLHLSRSLGLQMQPGDEIVVSTMDHDANVAPWLLLARDIGAEIRWLRFDTDSFEFDPAALDAVLGERTRLVCIAGASNLTGTLNDVRELSARARAAGALTFVDAVQSAPHVSTDVQALGCDFLVCSAYKFFGPHVGILWGRRELLESLSPYKARPAPDELPWRFETGTQNHEGIAGAGAAVDHFAWVGETMADDAQASRQPFDGYRGRVHAGIECLLDHERVLADRLLDGLLSLPGVRVLGITDPGARRRRVPTVSFVHERHAPATIARALADRNIFVWSGHNYALEVAKALRIDTGGGAVRIGPVHYNTVDEIDTLVAALDEILGQ